MRRVLIPLVGIGLIVYLYFHLFTMPSNPSGAVRFNSNEVVDRIEPPENLMNGFDVYIQKGGSDEIYFKSHVFNGDARNSKLLRVNTQAHLLQPVEKQEPDVFVFTQCKKLSKIPDSQISIVETVENTTSKFVMGHTEGIISFPTFHGAGFKDLRQGHLTLVYTDDRSHQDIPLLQTGRHYWFNIPKWYMPMVFADPDRRIFMFYALGGESSLTFFKCREASSGLPNVPSVAVSPPGVDVPSYNDLIAEEVVGHLERKGDQYSSWVDIKFTNQTPLNLADLKIEIIAPSNFTLIPGKIYADFPVAMKASPKHIHCEVRVFPKDGSFQLQTKVICLDFKSFMSHSTKSPESGELVGEQWYGSTDYSSPGLKLLAKTAQDSGTHWKLTNHPFSDLIVYTKRYKIKTPEFPEPLGEGSKHRGPVNNGS